MLNNALDQRHTVLLEGGQATLLDVDHGTYPFVTSSNPTAAAPAPARASADPHRPGHRGRQGLHDPGRRGPVPDRACRRRPASGCGSRAEFGTTTGRPRRCGWYDAVIARYAARVNGVTDFVLTKLDVLSGFETIPVCVGYRLPDGTVSTRCR